MLRMPYHITHTSPYLLLLMTLVLSHGHDMCIIVFCEDLAIAGAHSYNSVSTGTGSTLALENHERYAYVFPAQRLRQTRMSCLCKSAKHSYQIA